MDAIDPLAIAREFFPDQPLGFPFEKFNLGDLKLPKDDDLGIKSDDEDADADDVEYETGFGSVVGEHLRSVVLAIPRWYSTALILINKRNCNMIDSYLSRLLHRSVFLWMLLSAAAD